jgi:gluconolactonase
MKKTFVLISAIIVLAWACGDNGRQNSTTSDSANTPEKKVEDIPVITSISVIMPGANKFLDTSAKVEELAKGFGWSEGPVWSVNLNAILFSDVKNNKIYKWSEKDGISVFLEKSGYTDSANLKGEEGSNGLTIDSEGDLILCQHGDRRIALLTSGIQNPKSEYTTLANKYNEKKFNSPNDLAIKSNGDIYFTDPPYGLKDPAKREIKFNGVYKLATDGEVALLLDSLSSPNGIAFAPDEKTIYIANSDPAKAVWYAYKVDDKGLLKDGKIFFDVTKMAKNGEPGLPDGLKIHKSGTIFATGPGGVYLFSPKGEELGIIKTSKATANLAFDKDQKYLYMTTTDRLLRLKLK